MNSMINEDDLKEFRQEGAELLEAAEKALLSLEDGGHYPTQYNAIFRAFHNLKGAAGMMEMLDLQAHTHVLETELVSLKDAAQLTSEQIDYFLKGIDTAKKMLWGESIDSTLAVNVVPSEPAQPVAAAAATYTNEPEKQKLNVLEPTRFLLFSDAGELDQITEELKKNPNLEVHNHSDYIDGITKYDSLKPHVIFISPAFKQTTPEELKSILKKDGHIQMFIDFDFTSLPVEFLMKYIRSHFENINLKNLSAEAAHLLKFQYADLCEYLKSSGREHLEKSLTEEMRDFLSFKSLINQKFKL
jgi:chemotaxis protein histidine kinase CheA